MSNAKVSKLRVYPIKSLGFIEANEFEVGMHSLKYDRQFAMIDRDGRMVNGKRTNQVNKLATQYDLEKGLITLSSKGSDQSSTFELRQGNDKLDSYLSDFFDIKLNIIENTDGEFMDIPMESSVTIVSEASLKYLQKDMDEHSLESIRLRFRSNIEITGVEEFWEEGLYHTPGVGVRFRLGEVEMIGISPRARCNVPPQNPDTGDLDYHFVKNMIEVRKAHVDTADKILQYGRTHYFLCINVYVPDSEKGKRIHINDEIEFLGQINFS